MAVAGPMVPRQIALGVRADEHRTSARQRRTDEHQTSARQLGWSYLIADVYEPNSTRRVEFWSVALCFSGRWSRLCSSEVHAGTSLTQGLELRPVPCELLDETPLCGNGVGSIGLRVLRAGKRRGGNRIPRVCLVEAVELRRNLCRCRCLGSLRPRGHKHRRQGRTAARAVLLI